MCIKISTSKFRFLPQIFGGGVLEQNSHKMAVAELQQAAADQCRHLLVTICALDGLLQPGFLVFASSSSIFCVAMAEQIFQIHFFFIESTFQK